MSKKSLRWFLCLCAAVAIGATVPVACSDTASGTADGGGGTANDAGTTPEDTGGSVDAGQQTGDTGTQDAGETDTGAADAGASDAGADDAGAPLDGGPQTIGMMLNVSIIEMMGTQIGVAVGAFYPETNIVPFDPSAGIKGFAPDTCRTPGAATAECKTDADCTHTGQICVAQKDSNGQPIANSEQCVNPTSAPVDIGPVTVEGFTDGAHDLKYNAGQNGAYTIDGQGDGSIQDTSIITVDSDYTLSGAGDPTQGLGAFSGTFHVPPAIDLLEPVPQPWQFGKDITLDVTADITFKWAGSSNGYVKITIQGDNSGIECLAKDDGEFTVPATAMTALKLSTNEFLNIVNFERTMYGTASGPGLVNPQISSMMTIMVNAKAP